MTFTVTYRAKDGALREEAVEAADRAACMAECRRRGIAPTKIVEGKGASRRRDGGVPSQRRQDGGTPSQRRLTGKAAILAAVVLVAVAGGVWWWVARPEAAPYQAEKPAKPKVEKPKAEKPMKPLERRDQPAVTNAPPPKPVNPNEEIYVDARGVKRYKVGNGRVFDPDRPRRSMNVRYDKDGNLRHKSSFAIFGNRAENEIASLIAVKPGTTIFGMRRYDAQFEAEFLESLKTPIEILDTDTPREKALKQGMIEVKREIADKMAKGEKLADILKGARDELRREATYRRELQKKLLEISDTPELTAQEMKDYVDAANVMLKERGIAPIHASSFIRSALQIERAEKRETAGDAPVQNEGESK